MRKTLKKVFKVMYTDNWGKSIPDRLTAGAKAQAGVWLACWKPVWLEQSV